MQHPNRTQESGVRSQVQPPLRWPRQKMLQTHLHFFALNAFISFLNLLLSNCVPLGFTNKKWRLSTHTLGCLAWGKGGREKMGRRVERERTFHSVPLKDTRTSNPSLIAVAATVEHDTLEVSSLSSGGWI